MKKNISINISGIIFHIEEDGYENLKKYLDSINKYFSSFEDSSEILADIESRIAEIFLSKLNEEKQVITAEDVNALVATMGSVSDFKAAEEEDFQKAEASANTSTDAGSAQQESSGSSQSSGSTSSSSQRTYVPPKSLSRDQRRKILGGVCSGIANYMNVDAVWIRLLFALLAFAYGFTFFVYIVMWIVVPGSYDLEEPEVEKKLFRDTDRKVIGGVAGGVAAFLGIDITLVRILFVVFTIAGGLGFFVYIVMWVILPEAKTLTDRMQMQGEPVTLSNIESNIKKNLGEQNAQEESTATKILMFPFRLIGIILSAIAKILVPIIEVLRVAIGIVIVIFGLSAVFATLVAGLILIGAFSGESSSFMWSDYNEINFPLHTVLRAVPGWVAFAGFLASLAPGLMILLLGISVIAKKIVFSAAVGWSLFAMFFISSALLAVGIPRIVYGFKEDGESEITTNYPVKGKRIYINVREVGLDDYRGARLIIEGYDGKDIKLEQRFESHGSTRQKAIENIDMIDYHVEQRDSVFTFDSNVSFKPDAVFREQRVFMTLYIPYGQEFQVDRQIHRMIDYGFDYDYYGNPLKYSEKGLECVTCPAREEEPISDLQDFDQLEVTGKFDLRIVRGDQYKVELAGSEKEKDRYEIYRHGETLVIDYEGDNGKNFKFENLRIDEVRITVTMPSLDKLELTGYGTARFDEFTSDDLDINIKGPVKVKGDINTERLSITMSGKAEADLSGRTHSLNADLELASKLSAYGLDVFDAFIEARLASSAKVTVTGTLEMEELGASDIDYRGNPNIIRRN
jgi:phage shock protein PspC (stress-responsive transcriptional regulator)